MGSPSELNPWATRILFVFLVLLFVVLAVVLLVLLFLLRTAWTASTIFSTSVVETALAVAGGFVLVEVSVGFPCVAAT